MVDLCQLSNVLDSSSWHLFLLRNQSDSSHSSNSELRTEDLVREKFKNHPDLRVGHGLYLNLAWRRVTLEKNWNRIWNQRFSKNKNLDCLPLLVASLATAAWSFTYYYILNGELDLRRKKPHNNFENGCMMDVQLYSWRFYENLTCYLISFKPFTAGTELFLSRILHN